MGTRKINHITVLAVVLVFRVEAADPVAKSMETSLLQQKRAVSSMAASLEAQRQSLQKQTRPASSFFVLPPLPPVQPVSTAAVPAWNPAPECPPLPATELDALIGQAAEREELKPELIRSVIQQESAARPCAVSSKGALGLMQLMPATALQLGVVDAFDPKENVDAGAHFLKQLLTAYGGDVSLALGAFNAGPGKVNQAGGVPDYPETLDYVRKVLSLLPAVQ
jgi:soluble lytic murein transglycosylase-like protein